MLMKKNPDKFGRYCPGTDILIKDEKIFVKRYARLLNRNAL